MKQMFGIGLLIVPLVFIMFGFFIAAIIKSKSKEEEGGVEDMFKQLYVYLVLFTTLIMSIGGGVGVFMAVADIVSPTGYVQTFTEYKQYGAVKYDDNGEEIKTQKSEEELKNEYEAFVFDEETRMKKQSKNSLIKSFGFILIPFPVFLYFNRLRRKNDKEDKN